jgi:hypothetical protein
MPSKSNGSTFPAFFRGFSLLPPGRRIIVLWELQKYNYHKPRSYLENNFVVETIADLRMRLVDSFRAVFADHANRPSGILPRGGKCRAVRNETRPLRGLEH